MRLTPPMLHSKDSRCETRYLAHCANVALILTHADTVAHAKARIEEYQRTVGIESTGEEKK